jgi:two-component system nitrate/nitrite response regulator NarL
LASALRCFPLIDILGHARGGKAVPNRSSKRVRSNQPPGIARSEPNGRRAAIRLLLLAEHAINRDGLRVLFDAESDFRVVGSATDWTDAARAHACRADVIVVDLSTARVPDRVALRALTTICAPAPVIMLTPELDHSQIAEALRLGVRGIVAKNVTTELLFKCVRVVAAGHYWVERDIVADLTQRLRLRAPAPSAAAASRRNPFGLTGRELEVVSLLIAGHANKAIADKCGIRERTVKQHLTNMFDKTGVSNRLELALFALQQRLVVPDGASRPARSYPR